jgi:K+/H+ antiporter YhaU regulatory subunit KhtT
LVRSVKYNRLYLNFSSNKIVKDEVFGIGHMQFIELTVVSLVGFKRGNEEYIVNPSRELVMQPHDKIFVLGNSEQIEAVQARLKL